MSSADFPGRSIPVNDIVLICDLDETLLDCNSFPRWVRFILNGKMEGLGAGRRLLLSLRAGFAVAYRKLHLCSHYAMKRRLQTLWARALQGDMEAAALRCFFEELCAHIRPNVKTVLELIDSGGVEAVLASAAAGEYAAPFGRMLGFKHVLATPSPALPDAAEFRSQEKCDRVLAWLQAQGLTGRKRIFLTDHEEDLPFMRESQLVLWFGAPDDVAALKQQAPGVEIVGALHLSDEEVQRFLGA